MSKPRVAFFDFTCCEGCQLQMANLGEDLLEVLSHIEVVMFREVMSEKSEDYDIAIVEGSITTPHDIERIKEIREKAKVLVALGSCAAIGGINGMKNNFSIADVQNYVYGGKGAGFPSIPTRALNQVVKVDYMVYGCPVWPHEFLNIFKAILFGVPYSVKDEAVCTECRLNENECMYDKGVNCLGPITRAGCNSWCINNGNTCYGCRGILNDPATNGCAEVMKKHNLTVESIQAKIDMYNKPAELKEQV